MPLSKGPSQGQKFAPFLGPKWPLRKGLKCLSVRGRLRVKIWPHFWGQNGPKKFTVRCIPSVLTLKYGQEPSSQTRL